MATWLNPPSTYTISALMPPAKAAPSFKAAGRWNTMRVTAKGDRMTVSMNGEQAVDVEDKAFPAGPFALQYATGAKGIRGGAIKWRKVYIKPI
jgi:hypothetical protein